MVLHKSQNTQEYNLYLFLDPSLIVRIILGWIDDVRATIDLLTSPSNSGHLFLKARAHDSSWTRTTLSWSCVLGIDENGQEHRETNDCIIRTRQMEQLFNAQIHYMFDGRVENVLMLYGGRKQHYSSFCAQLLPNSELHTMCNQWFTIIASFGTFIAALKLFVVCSRMC